MTLSDYGFNGETALRAILKRTSYKTLEQAIASFTVFTHPKIVEHTQNKALFRIRRARGGEKKGAIVSGVMLCDNKSPTDAFLWANELVGKRRPKEVQLNHIYPLSQEPDYYTSLANLCMTPAFLAKLTDTNPEIINLLRYRAWRIYKRFLPTGFKRPKKPKGYDDLIWAPYPTNRCTKKALRQKIQDRIDACPKSRLAKFTIKHGWLNPE